MEAVNDTCIFYFMHGAEVEVKNGHTAKSILCVVIDDHSRVIVGNAFSTQEAVSALTMVLKTAFETHGLPRRLYVDNRSAFSSELLLMACARTKISLSHSKPYDSPSRGKIERFFRTVRDRFLSGLSKHVTLEEINEAFDLWLKEDYHDKMHSGIDASPMDCYRASWNQTKIRRLSKAELDEAFLARHERIVNNDATISFKGKIYEVPSAYIRQRIEISHPADNAEELYLFENGARISRLKLVDAGEITCVFPSGFDEIRSAFFEQRDFLMQDMLAYHGPKRMPFDKSIKSDDAFETEPSKACAARLRYIKTTRRHHAPRRRPRSGEDYLAEKICHRT
jgi:hypothetical protein